MRYFLVVIMLVLSFGCFTKENQVGTRVSGPGFHGIILNEKSTTDLEIWIPNNKQVSELENSLPSYVQSQVTASGFKLSKRLSDYKRQYVGIKKDGVRLIMIHFFYNETEIVKTGEWLKGTIGVLGGGDNYLGAIYDTEKKLFTKFVINADA